MKVRKIIINIPIWIQGRREGPKKGGRILAIAYIKADILRIPKWYDTQRSDRWFKSYIFLKIGFQITILSSFFARNYISSTFKIYYYYFLLVFARVARNFRKKL